MTNRIAIDDGDDEKTITTPNCRLIFRRVGDRWTHRIEAVSRSGCTGIADAIESDSEFPDPRRVNSPTYQEIVLSSRASISDEQLATALTVGLEGPHHFSASFTVSYLVEDPQRTTLIHVEVADRCREHIEWIGATYDLMLPGIPEQHAQDDLTAHWGYLDGEQTVGFLFQAKPSAQVELLSRGPDRFQPCAKLSVLDGRPSQRFAYAWAVITLH